jgi:hypothetical protein
MSETVVVVQFILSTEYWTVYELISGKPEVLGKSQVRDPEVGFVALNFRFVGAAG